MLLQRACATDLHAAVKTSVGSVDVYKMPAIIIFVVKLEARWLGTPAIALKSTRTPHSKLCLENYELDGEMRAY